MPLLSMTMLSGFAIVSAGGVVSEDVDSEDFCPQPTAARAIVSANRATMINAINLRTLTSPPLVIRRAGEFPAAALSVSLSNLGFQTNAKKHHCVAVSVLAASVLDTSYV